MHVVEPSFRLGHFTFVRPRTYDRAVAYLVRSNILHPAKCRAGVRGTRLRGAGGATHRFLTFKSINHRYHPHHYNRLSQFPSKFSYSPQNEPQNGDALTNTHRLTILNISVSSL